MSKTFNGTTDSISLGSPAGLDNIRPITIAAWIYPVGWGETGQGRIYEKSAGAASGPRLRVNNAVLASCAFNIDHATTDPDTIAAADTLSLNKWWFLAGSFTAGDGGCRLWVGDAATAVVEPAYYQRPAEAGAAVADQTNTAFIGNSSAGDRTFDGRISHLSVWAGVLTAAQLDLLRLYPWAPSHNFGVTLKGYWPLWDESASACLDQSGNANNGTVTGTSVGIEPETLAYRRFESRRAYA